MVDFLLVVSILVALAVLSIGAVYLLVYYQHPDDHNEAWVPKLVVIFGFVLAGATVLMLPLDVANNEGYAGTCRLQGDDCIRPIWIPVHEEQIVSSTFSHLLSSPCHSWQVAMATIPPFAEAFRWNSCGILSFGRFLSGSSS
jgi:hypothetical protein